MKLPKGERRERDTRKGRVGAREGGTQGERGPRHTGREGTQPPKQTYRQLGHQRGVTELLT